MISCAADMSGLVAALDAAALPSGDVNLPGRTFFRFLGADGEHIGYGGYELLGDVVLLRSIVVPPGQRGYGHGRHIVGSLTESAAAAGATAAYLLTETSAGFFETIGFTTIDRADVPPQVLETKQATDLCPSSARVLWRPIGRAGGRRDPRKARTVTVLIYHNPDCGTSRNVLALIRNSGEVPYVVEYLRTPPTRGELMSLIDRMGVPVRDVLRQKGTPYEELQLGNPALTDDELIDAMMAHPILINRPIVVTALGVKLCRPSEAVLDLLPRPQRAVFAKEDGEAVIDAGGNRIARPGS